MTLEKLFVKRNVFNTFYFFIAIYFDDPVDKQERVSMRQYPLYLSDVKQRFGTEAYLAVGLGRHFVKTPGKGMIERMTAFVRDDTAIHRTAHQSKIANKIHDLMPYALVAKTITVLDRTVGIDNKNVARSKMCPDTVGLHLPCFGFERKSSRTGKFLLEIVRTELATVKLPADPRMLGVVKVVSNIQFFIVTRQRVNRLVALSQTDRLGYYKFLALSLLCNNFRPLESLKEFIAAAVKSGQLRPAYLNDDVIYLKSAYSGQAMFGRLNTDSAISQGGAAITLGDVFSGRFYLDRFGKIRAHKDRTGIDIGGSKHQLNVGSAKQTLTGKLNFATYCLLQFQVL